MNRLRITISALCVATGLAGIALTASAQAPDAMPVGGAASDWRGPARGGEFGRVLRALNLTGEQRTQIRSILQQAKPQLKALRASLRANHEALADAAPTDPNYPSLLATEKANAAARVQAMSDLKAQIYAVLTPEQQAQIPALLAQARAARAARVAAWRSGAQ